MVRADLALRRHWLLIFCAFTFCWLHGLRTAPATVAAVPTPATTTARKEKKGSRHSGRLGPVRCAGSAAG
jgi:hypothetical protein